MNEARALQNCLHCGKEFYSADVPQSNVQSKFRPLSQAVGVTECLPDSLANFNSIGPINFCCSGCDTVWKIIHEGGLSNYYLLRDQTGLCRTDRQSPLDPGRFISALSPNSLQVPSQLLATPSEQFSYCDDPELIRELASSDQTMRFFIENLECAACVWLLERLPQICPDADFARVSFSDSTIEVRRKSNGSFAKIAEAINRLGYHPRLVRSTDDEEKYKKNSDRKDLIRIAVAGACAGNIMILSISLYAGASGQIAIFFQWLAAFIALPLVFYCSLPIYKNVLRSLRHLSLSLDLPIAAAIVAGFGVSISSLVSGGGEIYFDSLSMLVFLLLSSRYFLKRIQQSAIGRSRLLNLIMNGTVVRITGNKRETMSAFSLHSGDRIEISGDLSVPIDGIVVEGEGWIDTSIMTGESAPQSVKIGERVEAGARNLGGTWILEVEEIAGETRLAKILRETERAVSEKPTDIQFADRVGKIFTIVVSFGSLGLIAWGFLSGNIAEGIHRALALTIVSCPCVFGMAIPLTLSLASRRAAALGALIKTPSCWENLARAKAVYFDKTGTLTRGDLSVKLINFQAEPIDEKYFEVLLALERGSRHPVAISLVRFLVDKGVKDRLKIGVIEAIPGGGLRAKISGESYEVVSTVSEPFSYPTLAISGPVLFEPH